MRTVSGKSSTTKTYSLDPFLYFPVGVVRPRRISSFVCEHLEWTERKNIIATLYINFIIQLALKEWHKHKNIVFILRPVLSAWHDLQAVPSCPNTALQNDGNSKKCGNGHLQIIVLMDMPCLCLGARERRKAARKSSVGRLARRVTFAAGFIELLQIYKRLENVFDFPRTWRDLQSLPEFFQMYL